MKKFEIRKNTAEVASKNDIKEGVTLFQESQEPELINSFDSKEKALEALNNYTSTSRRMEGWTAPYYIVTEFYIEENEYNEDGEWIEGGDVWFFAKNDWTSNL